MRIFGFVAMVCGGALLSGCATGDSPLIFGKVNTFGASVSATAPDQGGNVVLGYRSANIAVVPVYARDASGSVVKMGGAQRGANSFELVDSFSTFAHFEAAAGSGSVKGVCLGDTFATGNAANRLAENLEHVCKP